MKTIKILFIVISVFVLSGCVKDKRHYVQPDLFHPESALGKQLIEEKTKLGKVKCEVKKNLSGFLNTYKRSINIYEVST